MSRCRGRQPSGSGAIARGTLTVEKVKDRAVAVGVSGMPEQIFTGGEEVAELRG